MSESEKKRKQMKKEKKEAEWEADKKMWKEDMAKKIEENQEAVKKSLQTEFAIAKIENLQTTTTTTTTTGKLDNAATNSEANWLRARVEKYETNSQKTIKVQR